MNLKKNPFQKVRSKIERKKLFERLIQEKGEIVCKTTSDQMFRVFEIRQFSEQRIIGKFSNLEGVPESSGQIVGTFLIGDEKVLFSTEFEVVGQSASISIDGDVFQLQRRSDFRVPVTDSQALVWKISQFEGQPVALFGSLRDFSAGGCRILLQKDTSAVWKNPMPIPAIGNRFFGTLRISELKTMDLHGVIRHQTAAAEGADVSSLGEFGVEFIELTPQIKNRLLSLSLDLQKKKAFE